MKFDKLYAKSSAGKTKTWEIEAKDNVMVIRTGYLDGKIIESSKSITGVNAGKSNETNDEQQCILECKSKWQKKVDEQYTTDLNNIKEYADQDILLPMLALKYSERKHDIIFPCFAQPKLNGVRCIFQGNKFMSRKGKEYTTLEHLIPELEKLGIDVPDGEIYIHGMSLQEIVSRVKEDKGYETDRLEYWIYDQVNDKEFWNRSIELYNKFTSDNFIKLKKVMTVKVNSEAEIKQWHDKWVQEGFEGAIIRNINGLYKVKHRSKDLQKYKEFIDAEFIIVGAHEGKGLEKGAIVFEVKNDQGKVFSVRPRGTRETRIEWMKDIKNLLGKQLTVRYQNLSDDGIPIFPVGICVRDYE